MPTQTTNYDLLKPLVNNATDQDLWGGYLNDDMDDIDVLLRAGITMATQSSQITGFTADASISVKKLYPCDATSAGFTATIPAAATAENGATVAIKKTDSSSNTITLARSASDTLDGATSLTITDQNGCYVLVSDGVSKWHSIAKPSATGVFKAIRYQRFTVDGTYTPDANLLYSEIELVGGGGGGGGANSNVAAGGGGGGGYAKSIKTAAAIGASQAVSIGAGGTAGSSSGTSGGTGGTTSVGSLLSATGGLGGVGGSAGSGASTPLSGGAGGSTITGDRAIPGGPGGSACDGNTNQLLGGFGGNSMLGFGGLAPIGQNSAGNAGQNYGGGGSGAVGTGANNNGGAGAAGVVFITEYCSQ